MQSKKSFIAYNDWEGTFNSLPDEMAGKLIKALFNYANHEEIPDDPILKALLSQFKNALQRDSAKWEEQRKQRSEAGKRSAEKRQQEATESNERSTFVESRERKATDNVNVSVNVSDSVTDNGFSKEKKRDSSRFKPPTIQEIKEYIKEKKYIVDANTFFSHYEGNGWKVGPNKMKNWKATVSGWHHRNIKDGKDQHQQQTRPSVPIG